MKNYIISVFIAFIVLVSGQGFAAESIKQGTKGVSRQEEMLAKLPKEKAELYKQAMSQAREKNKPKRETVKVLRQEMSAVMAAPAFDKGAYLEKSKKIQVLMGEIQQGKAEATAEVAAKMTPEERKVLSEGRKRHALAVGAVSQEKQGHGEE